MSKKVLKNGIHQIINKLNKNEQKIILKTLINEQIPFTKNNNGYFFNMSQYNNDSLQHLYDTLLSINENRKVIKDLDDNRNRFVIECKKVIEDNLKNTLHQKMQNYNKFITKLNDSSNIIMNIEKIPKEVKPILKKQKFAFVDTKMYTMLKNLKSRHKNLKNKINDNYYEDEKPTNDTNDINDVNDTENEENEDDDINDTETEIEPEPEILDSEINEEDETFYINLLKEKGYFINTDKSCLLVMQDYIN